MRTYWDDDCVHCCDMQYLNCISDSYDPKQKYCGSGALGRLVPDRGLRSNFGECCQAHDKCYGTCGADKSECDSDFLSCMKVYCNANWPTQYPRGVPYPLPNPLRNACMAAADAYYNAVSKYGDAAFRDAQNYCVPAWSNKPNTPVRPNEFFKRACKRNIPPLGR